MLIQDSFGVPVRVISFVQDIQWNTEIFMKLYRSEYNSKKFVVCSRKIDIQQKTKKRFLSIFYIFFKSTIADLTFG